MKDADIVKLWGGSPRGLFIRFAQDEWQVERWGNIWSKHRLLPSVVRQHILKEVSYVQDQKQAGSC